MHMHPRTTLPALTALVVLAGCAAPPTSLAAWQGCKAYSDQPSAQTAWEAAGKPAGADGDGDGKVCETLPNSPSSTPPPSNGAQAPSSPGAALPTPSSAPAPGSLSGRVSPLKDPRGLHPGLSAVPGAQRARARRLIRRVRIARGGSRAGYSRSQFGAAWTDDQTTTWGHDGCKTREQILRRDLRAIEYRAGTNDCVVLTGILQEPYTARTIEFTKADPLAVQIDHVIALAYGWSQGATRWTQAKREQYANDPLNLLAVDGPANNEKSASGPADWLPPNTRVRCAYAVRFAQVSLKYRLPIEPRDKRKMLTTCGAR